MAEIGIYNISTTSAHIPVEIIQLEYPTLVVAGQEFTIRVRAKQTLYTYGAYGFGLGYHQGPVEKIRMNNIELLRGYVLRWTIRDDPGQIIDISVRVVLPAPGDYILFVFVHPQSGFQVIREIRIHVLSQDEWAIGSMLADMMSLLPNMMYLMITLSIFGLIMGLMSIPTERGRR